MRTAVIVLDDLGRSPRMQYHAASLAATGHDVDLVSLEADRVSLEADRVSLAGAPPMPAIVNHPRVACHSLPDASRLFFLLMRLPKADVMLVQNPPAIPALAVAWVVARLRGARLVIDWHNLSHTIAAVRLGEAHRAVKALSRRERRWARRADGHMAVSSAMAGWLSSHYGVSAAVVYNRPGAAFTPTLPTAAVALWSRLASEIHLGAERVPLVVCPTGWAPDEDFDLLLEALERADRRLPPVTSLAVILTGRGALRASFEARVARRSFTAIAVRTHWLEPADYPLLIGMADLGLCLHQSSSALDLPMKIADFRGAGVPVAAFDYAPVLSEVLTNGQEGVTFRDPGDLATILVTVASRQIASDSALGRSKVWLFENPAERWHSQWQASAWPVLRG
jgi:beta-1,4-mannosyltransferase